ncbi:MAG: helix-turn-helix domain-containing protein [Bacteroidia bacterium]
MIIKQLVLNENERTLLDTIIKKSADWRERDRAETIALLTDGFSVKEVATKQGYQPEAIRVRRRKWLKHGFASLPDQPRKGAPTKLTDDHRQLLRQWAETEPLSSRVLLGRLNENGAAKVSQRTLQMELKRMGFIWKRTRYSLKKSAIPNGLSKQK